MADFNKIFTDSPIIVGYEKSANLFYNNGRVISRNKFALENHTLSLMEDTDETISLFYNNGIATVYEFNTRLYQDNVQLPVVDIFEKEVGYLNKNNLLVFIDGELEPSDNYYVIEGNRLVIAEKHTFDQNKVFHIIVYASNVSFERKSYSKSQIVNPNYGTDSVFKKLASENYNDSTKQYYLETNYNVNKSMIFVNGVKVGFNSIEVFKNTEIYTGEIEEIRNDNGDIIRRVPKTRNANLILLNIPEKPNEINSIEIVNLFDNLDDTRSLNFVSRQGYLSYGPYDDYGNKVPDRYDTTITFADQAKLAIDNLRPGFILREANGTGKIVIVSDNFESDVLYGLTIERFKYTNYTKDEYFVEVPNTTSIVKYLSEYDTKYSFIPEILTIFQRLLLDEINDLIERLRESRSISKVDSVSINKLISLLGFNLNIKTLNKKQRRELLEELTEFYRVAGTRQSYNLVNILQNNLKLINMEQLFTIFGSAGNANSDETHTRQTVYTYDVTVKEGGTDYVNDTYLKPEDFPMEGRVVVGGDFSVATYADLLNYDVSTLNNGDVIKVEQDEEHDNDLTYYRWTKDTEEHPSGDFIFMFVGTDSSVTRFIPITSEGYRKVEGDVQDYNLITASNGLVNIKSTPALYRYNPTLNDDNYGFSVGQYLTTNNDQFKLQVTGVDNNGKINDFILNPQTGTTPLNLNDLQLYIDYRFIKLDIESQRNVEEFDPNDTVNFPIYQYEENGVMKNAEFTTGGQAFNLKLEPGEYMIVMSGAGGAGGSSDSEKGNTADTYAENGFSGEYKQTAFTITNTTTISGKVGQGGGRVKAVGSGEINFETRGAGYEAGKMGESTRGSWQQYAGYRDHLGGYAGNKVYKTRKYSSIGGQGGGSSAVILPTQTIIARGGNGGSASTLGGKADDYSYTNYTGVKGGLGGNGGIAGGGGAPGGARNQPDGTFWSHNGSDGYIRIYKIRQRYIGNPRGDFSTVSDGDVFNVTEGYIPFEVTLHKDGSTVTATMSPETGFPYCFYSVGLRNPDSNMTASLSISSTVNTYSYSAALTGLDGVRLREGDTLITEDDIYHQQFNFVITSINKDLGTYRYNFTPTSGPRPITINNKEVPVKTGTGAVISIRSRESSQNDRDRCYIDFYKKEELGAEIKKEYRIDYINYGYVTEGTPNSPYWWIVGNPDIDYGYISDEVNISKDYGLITDKIKGEWVEWWEWDRNPSYYATNHVELEMKMPIDVDFGEYIDTFIEQFYNLSSTVLFIHAIIESFYYGKETTDNSNPKANNGASFGIAAGAPLMYYSFPMASNPLIQYTQRVPNVFGTNPVV